VETPLAEATPMIDDITFALDATEVYDPIDPGDSFAEGVTEIHAIFDYEGMSPDYTWQRVWYLDDTEILNNSATWSGDEAGRFDYFIDANGSPQSPGEWVLELYVEGELLASGSFVIEVEATPEVAQVNTPTATTIRPVTPSPIIVPSQTPPPSGGGTFPLAFTKWDGGQHNLYVADTNGNNEKFILGRAAGPSWTPNGQTIFFYGAEGVDRQEVEGLEYTFDGISNGVVALTASPLPKNMSEIQLFQALGWKEGTGRTTTVSPNGQMVAFDARPGGGDYRIFFLGTSGNQQFQYQILGEQAAWSADSERLVYRSGRDGKTGLWISNRDDSGHTLITNDGSDSFPAWSPDGRTIAFSREAGGNVDIYTMNPDGNNIQRLTEAAGPDTLPVYTPTGDIIFRSARSGRWGIWKMNSGGGNQTEIIADANVGPDWSFSRMSVR
jgi:Tol biopolymer transport system component